MMKKSIETDTVFKAMQYEKNNDFYVNIRMSDSVYLKIKTANDDRLLLEVCAKKPDEIEIILNRAIEELRSTQRAFLALNKEE